MEKTKIKHSEVREYELADMGPRLISAIIDGIIIGVITGVLFGIGREPGGLLGTLINLAYYWYFWTRNNGQTIGKSIMGLQVIKANGQPMSNSDAVMRYIGYVLNSIVLGIGWIWALFDANKQGWHDKLANTYVVKAQ